MRLAASAVVVLIALIIILFLRGTFEKKADTSTMTITGGEVVYEEVAPIGEADFSELKDFVKTETEDHEGVKLLRISKKGDNAYVRTRYKDMTVYSEFTGYEGFLGTVAEAKRAVYDFDTSFSEVKDGAMADSVKGKKVRENAESKVLIIRENGRFKVDGNILFVSSESMTVVDGSTVDIAQAQGEEDATILSYIVYE